MINCYISDYFTARRKENIIPNGRDTNSIPSNSYIRSNIRPLTNQRVSMNDYTYSSICKYGIFSDISCIWYFRIMQKII